MGHSWCAWSEFSIGIGMGMSSYALAINTYFNKNRSKATAFAITISGIGIILFPQLTSFLLSEYSIKDTMLIVSAVAAHYFVAASLLQPVEWHMKPLEAQEENEECTEDNKLFQQQNHESGNTNVICDDIAAIHASMISLNIGHNRSSSDTHTKHGISPKISTMKRICNFIVNIFDLRLLKDFVFVNIVLGLSIEYFSDFNFIWLIPFLLMEKGLSVEETATFMSIYSIADLCLKFSAPFLATALKQPSRIMLIGALIGVISFRMFLPFVTNYTILIILAVSTGAFRGARLVYWQLILPEYIPIGRLASAFGLLFSLNGFFMIVAGPALGAIRDKTGNYTACVILLNGLALLTVFMWLLEIVYNRIRLHRILGVVEDVNLSK